MLKLSLNMLKLFKQTAGETLGTAGLTISIFSTCASPRWEACIQSYLKHKSLSLHELARAWAKRMQRGTLQVRGIFRMTLSSFVFGQSRKLRIHEKDTNRFGSCAKQLLLWGQGKNCHSRLHNYRFGKIPSLTTRLNKTDVWQRATHPWEGALLFGKVPSLTFYKNCTVSLSLPL